MYAHRQKSEQFERTHNSQLVDLKRNFSQVNPLTFFKQKTRNVAKHIIVFLLILFVFISNTAPVFAATFTAGSAKRDAPGPFTAGVTSQGNWDNTGTPDQIHFDRGTQIGSNFYQTADSEQGSIVVWFTPEWNGNDGKVHRLVSADNRWFIRKLANNNLEFRYIDSGSTPRTVVTDVTSWTAGSTYSIVARWDTRNKLDGTNYLSISINDAHTFGAPTVTGAGTVDVNTKVGSGDGNDQVDGIVEGLTIYRRPLFDGTYGIDVGNGDEIAQIYNSGSGKDPTLVTGSWDVVFALPTNSSTGVLTTGTGNAWSHPHSSNLLYTSTTNTGGFMMNGTYTSDGWANEGSPTAVAALSTSEKIFAGGYKTTSDAANEGIYYQKTVTAGNDWVVRALAHSDGTCTPKIILYDQTNGAEIGSLTGITTSTRTAPNTFIFTGEAPSGMTTLRAKLINTASSGTCYWHQVEVLSNLITNPSMETGSGDPWIPTGWTNVDIGSGRTEVENSTIHSGSSSMQWNSTNRYMYANPTVSNNRFAAFGMWSYGDSTSGFEMGGRYCGSIYFLLQHTTDNLCISTSHDTLFKHSSGVYRKISDNQFAIIADSGSTGSRFIDDVYSILLTDVSLTVTPASLANSTENTDEIRVDGRDTYVASSAEAVSIGTTTGYASFNYRPRHAAADMVKWAETTSDDAYVLSLAGDANDYVNVYWDSANTLKMEYSMNGTTASSTWTATGAIAANTEYALALSYTGGSAMTLSVDGTTRITLSSIPSSFGTAPNTVYFGSNTSSANQGDATFSNFTFDSTAPSISLTALSPDPTSDSTPTLTGTATEAIGTVSTVQFQMDSTAGSWSSCTADDGTFDEASEPFSCTSSALSDGSHTMYVRATDSNGNTTSSGSYSSDTFTVDSTAPSVSLTALTPDPNTDATSTFSGTATDTAHALSSIQFQVDSTAGSWSSCTADDGTVDETSEPFTCTTAALSDGSHTNYVRATDIVSNTTSSGNYGTDTFTIDATAPTTPGTPSTTSPTAETTPTWTWTASIDATSGLASTPYTVQWSQSSSFASGVSSSTSTTNSFTHTTPLSDGTWYFRVKATDAAGNESSYSSNGSVQINTGAPTGSITINSGNAYTNIRDVTLTLSASSGFFSSTDDIDMKISNLSDLSDASYDDFAATKSWTLTSGNGTKTVYVQFRDTTGNESGAYSDTITLDTAAPLDIELKDPGSKHYTNNERETFKWKATTDATSGLSKYKVEVDNGDKDDFTIDDIPPSRTEDYETTKYKVHYENFTDADNDNNYISVHTKSSVTWGNDHNDGKLKEGARNWAVKAVDHAGNEKSAGRTLFVDKTAPSVSFVQVNSTSTTSSIISTSDKIPTIFGKILDTLAGTSTNDKQDENGPKVASGPKLIEIQIEKKEGLTYKPVSITTLNVDTPWYTCTNIEVPDDNKQQKCDKYLPFEFTPKEALGIGTYRVTLTGKDKADNTSEKSMITLHVSTLAELLTPEEQQQFEDETKDLTPEEKQKAEEEKEVTKTQEPTVVEKTESALSKIGTALKNGIKTIASTIGSGLSSVGRLAYDSLAATAKGTVAIAKGVGNGLAYMGNGIANRINNTSLALADGYNYVAHNVPGAIGDTMVAIGNGVGTANKAVGRFANTVGDGINDTTSTIAHGVGSATNATKESIANIAFGIGEKTQDVSETAGFAMVKFGYLFVNEPTRIYDVQETLLSSTSVKITWQTNHPANGKVNWGYEDGNYDFDIQTDKRTTHHEFVIQDLNPDTQYHYEVISHNKNMVYDANRKFKTPEK